MQLKLLYILLISSALIFPQRLKLAKEIHYISKYITEIKSGSHLAKTDSIFLFAKNYTGSDNDALFALIFATVPYNKLPVTIPLFPRFNVPIPSAEQHIYLLKNDSLPKYFFFDTPLNQSGDKDKLAHFFGSAFLTNTSNIFGLGRYIGYFIEIFEKNFESQNNVDPRDLLVNYYGLCFGILIKQNTSVLPSEVLLHYDLFYNRINL